MVILAAAAQADPPSDRDKPAVDPGQGGSLSDLFGLGTETKVTSGQDSPDINEALKEAYNGPRARVAVARFIDKTGTKGSWYNETIGEGIADQMATALFNSNRFIVLERQNLDEVVAEQNLVRQGKVRGDTAVVIDEIEGAELLITGAVTELKGIGEDSDAGGSTISLGKLFSLVSRKAHIAIDVRVIDVRTSRIVAATSVEGKATSVKLRLKQADDDDSDGEALNSKLAIWRNTPIGKAMRICIQRAVDFIASKTPAVYYRHGRPASKLSATPRLPVQVYAIDSVIRVKKLKVNLRGGPSTDHTVLTSLTLGALLLVKEQSGSWVQVRTTDGQNGWLAGWLVYPDAGTSKKLFEAKAEEKIREAVSEPVSRGTLTNSAAGATGKGGGDEAAPTVEEEVSAVDEAAVKPAAATREPAAASAAAKAGIIERLRGLKAFFDEGLITEEHYDAKRHEILELF
jgi:curli biogenesis system outer membrane secretion channel CsgG